MSQSTDSAPLTGATRRMPAEWEPHDATWLLWPNAAGASFPGKWTPRIEPFFVNLVETIARFEVVELGVWDADEQRRVAAMLSEAARARTRFHVVPSREPWCRDIGPTFVVTQGPDSSNRVALKWRFNGWGEQWPHDIEDAAGKVISEVSADRTEQPGLVFEGGDIESNGAGTILVTEECLLDPMRNPELTRDAAEATLRERLGAERIVWLRGGVSGDDTGHTDVVARFVNPSTVVVSLPDDPGHPDWATLDENRHRLVEAGLNPVALPVPDLEFNGAIDCYLPKGYANFYLVNGAILAPSFEVPEDAPAHRILGSLFPERELIALDCRDVVFGQGSIHCLTQQVPSLP